MRLTLKTPVIELHEHDIANLSAPMSRKLAIAVAGYAGKSDAASVTVEDLLGYFPMRYEDRSRFVSIDRLEDGMEAAVEIYTKVSGGFQVGKNRGPKQPPLFIFEISGADAARMQKPVVVKWFVSGRQAQRIVSYYEERFARGTRFVAYGKWEWDKRLQTFSLMLSKPEELEILPNIETGLFHAAAHINDNQMSRSGDQVISLMIGNYFIKVAWEVLATPLTYKIVAFLKKVEHEDYYDRDTDFNPFSLET